MAKSCVLNTDPNVYKIEDCEIAAIRTIKDDYVMIGFLFTSFVVDSRTADIMFAKNKKISADTKQKMASAVQAGLAALQNWKRKLFLTTEDLCTITQMNCDNAKRLEQSWGQRSGPVR